MNTHTNLQAAIGRAAELLDGAQSLVIAAGAGIGVDSGLPDFRGDAGFWRAYPALADAGIRFDQIADPESFETKPRLTWGFYGHRLALYRRTVPHAGFTLLKRWTEMMYCGGWTFTSNVDGQFQLAGFSGHSLHEFHGSIHHLQCSVPCGQDVWSARTFEPEVDERQCLLVNELPTCPRCGAIARPNLVLFGDRGFIDDRVAEQEARQEEWLAQCKRPLVIEIGAGTAIPSVRAFSRRMNAQFGARLIRINPREHDLRDERDVALPLGSLAALTAIAMALGKDWQV